MILTRDDSLLLTIPITSMQISADTHIDPRIATGVRAADDTVRRKGEENEHGRNGAGAMYEQIVISAGDLRFLTIQCYICNASVTFDLNRIGSVAPGECWNCADPLDSAITDAVKSIQKAYKALAGLGKRVSFAIPVPAPAPAARPEGK